jgi:ABC-type transport system involved in multi-copper enzyme maturation permease subunit
MRLYEKAWHESRGRFLLAAGIITVYCVSFVQRAHLDFPPRIDPSMPYTTFVWRGIYAGPCVAAFILSSIALGMGGLQRERASGSADFTIALPISRVRLVTAPAVVGALQMGLLTLIPAVVVPWLSPPYVGHVYPLGAALQFALLFACTGALWIGVGMLMSVFMSESLSSVAAVLVPAAWIVVTEASAFRSFPFLSPLNVMNGARMPHFDAGTSLFVGALPWNALLGMLALAVALVCVAGLIVQRQDF